MHIVQASLDGPHHVDDGMPDVLTDLVWAHTTAAHGLEHVRAKTSDCGIELYLFLRAASEASAIVQAHTILTSVRALLRVHGYTVALPPS